MSAPMVRAILEGRKTMTRRVIKFNLSGRVEFKNRQWHIADPNAILACPYQIGQTLWVRESFNYDEDTIYYKADGNHPSKYKWKPSIFMPRWASRITLEVTDIKVERLQEISEEDAQKEGLKLLQGGIVSEFAVLWDSINGKKYPWVSNPWVWVIGFKIKEAHD